MHNFHVPVMGTGFTIDSPLKIAQFGISSVISLVDDILIEQMRKFHSKKAGEPYTAVSSKNENARSDRITQYLNLLNLLINRQIKEIKSASFSPGSKIVRYFELLPDSEARRLYDTMVAEDDPDEKSRLQESLRDLVVPGSIDVNIMTKVDRDLFDENGEKRHPFSDALTALRGFALSDVNASIVFSAGMNKRLFRYITQFEDFFQDHNGEFRKRVILKVSDFRSAMVQGNFLARLGIWVSEFRIESGLNCGGHAFPTSGNLMGPILEEFKERKNELIEKLYAGCNKTLEADGRKTLGEYPEVKFTVQGGIGTSGENNMMMEHYQMDGTGWATPFMLVPEATNIDDAHLDKLIKATDEEVYLDYTSPLGVPFWSLKNSDCENARRQRIKDGNPGSPCPKGYLYLNSDFTERPICIASREYQHLKLNHLDQEGYNEEQMAVVKKNVLNKNCICHDLGGGVKLKNKISTKADPALCPGPNMVNFSRLASLEEMVNHIYGRGNIVLRPERVHMFIKELKLNVDFLRDEMDKFSLQLSNRKQKYFDTFKENLFNGIEYYQNLPEKYSKGEWHGFREELKTLYQIIETLELETAKTQ